MSKITTAVLTLHYSEEKFQNHLIAARSNQQVSKVSQILHLKLVNHFLKEDIIFILFLALKQKISARRNRCFRFPVQRETICKERIELLNILSRNGASRSQVRHREKSGWTEICAARRTCNQPAKISRVFGGPWCVDRVYQAKSSSTTWCPLFMGWWGALRVAVVGGGISRGLHSPPFSYPHHVLRLPLTFT